MRSYDFPYERTHDGRAFRLLTVVDEYSRECLAIDVKRRMNHQDVLGRLAEWFVERGVLHNTSAQDFSGMGWTSMDSHPNLERGTTRG